MNYDVPLYTCHTSCPWVTWASVFVGLKLSSYLEIFQPVIMKFFLYSPVSNFLLDSIYIYCSILKVVSKFCDGQLIFPHIFFHYYFPCLYLTYSIFFSFMNIRIIAVVSILMSFLANYVMYIFNCAFTNWLFHPYEYFLASLDIWNFFLFKIIYLNLRITTLQYTDGTRTSLKVTEDQDSRTGHKSHSWLKRARSVKEEETIFTGVCERLDKYHPDLFAVIEHVFTNWYSPHFGYFLASLDIWNFFLFKFIYLS